MLNRFDQVSVVKLKGCRKLAHQLVDTVEKLQKDGATLIGILAASQKPTSVSKLVTELYPLSLNKNLETLQFKIRLF